MVDLPVRNKKCRRHKVVHRNSVQNAPIDKFTALTGTIFVTGAGGNGALDGCGRAGEKCVTDRDGPGTDPGRTCDGPGTALGRLWHGPGTALTVGWLIADWGPSRFRPQLWLLELARHDPSIPVEPHK